MKTSSVVKPNLLVSKSNLSDYASQGERRQSIYTGLNKRKSVAEVIRLFCWFNIKTQNAMLWFSRTHSPLIIRIRLRVLKGKIIILMTYHITVMINAPLRKKWLCVVCGLFTLWIWPTMESVKQRRQNLGISQCTCFFF